MEGAEVAAIILSASMSLLVFLLYQRADDAS
jgi:hypothetical protein